MVKDCILINLARQYFRFDSGVQTILDGVINSTGSVVIIRSGYPGKPIHPVTGLHVKFGKVTGNFDIENAGLDSFVGCPEVVGESGAPAYFDGRNNKIKSLIGGPKYVNGSYWVDRCEHLTSLDGLPCKVECVDISIQKNLPILRLVLLDCGSIHITNNINLGFLLRDIRREIKCGLSKKEGLWKLQAEMIKLGFEDNAHW
jgi:hypothetical protein